MFSVDSVAISLLVAVEHHHLLPTTYSLKLHPIPAREENGQAILVQEDRTCFRLWFRRAVRLQAQWTGGEAIHLVAGGQVKQV